MAHSSVEAEQELLSALKPLGVQLVLTAHYTDPSSGQHHARKFKAAICGCGGQGTVFQCLAVGLQGAIAAKFHQGQSKDAFRRHEMLIYNRIRSHRCKYVARVFQVMRCTGDVRNEKGEMVKFDDHAIIMEYCPSTLQHVCFGGELDLITATVIIQQLAHALHDIHRAGVAHFDIKPENVLFSAKTAEVRLADFGFAVAVGLDDDDASGPGRTEHAIPGVGSSITGISGGAADAASARGAAPVSSSSSSASSAGASAGASAGSSPGTAASVATAPGPGRHPESVMVDAVEAITAEYAAPEAMAAMHGEATGPLDGAKCDMWSLGVTIFAMVFRKLPFDPATASASVTALEAYRLDPARQALAKRDHVGFWAVQQERGAIQPEAKNSPGHSEVARWIDHLLTWDPDARARASALLSHSWLSGAIPTMAIEKARTAVAERVARAVAATRETEREQARRCERASAAGDLPPIPRRLYNEELDPEALKLGRTALHGPLHLASLGFLSATVLLPAAAADEAFRVLVFEALRLDWYTYVVGSAQNTLVLVFGEENPQAVPQQRASGMRAIVTAHEVGGEGADSALSSRAACFRLVARVEAGDANSVRKDMVHIFGQVLDRFTSRSEASSGAFNHGSWSGPASAVT